MISNHDLDEAESETGMKCEQIFSPFGRHAAKRITGGFCVDNGAFAKFNPVSFLSLLDREKQRKELCRFVAVPDVVGSARRTAEAFDHWYGELSGWPLAYVCQDGQENISIPWKLIASVFIGGTTDWKMGSHAKACIQAGLLMGKWVHVGRVNSARRLSHFEALGVDSVDGTGLSRFKNNRESVRLMQEAKTEPQLDLATSADQPTIL